MCGLVLTRAFELGVVLAAVASLAAAPEPITLWHTQDRTQAEILAGLVKDFSRESGVPVTLETGLDLMEALVVQAESGRPPDAVLAPSDITSLAARIALDEIPQAMNAGVATELLSTVSLGGRIYGVPVFDGNHLVLYYNRKLVKTPASTWEELEALKPIAMHFDAPYSVVPFFGGNISFTERCSEAIQAYKELVDRGVIKRDCDYACVSDDFYAGKFSYAINGDWAFGDASRVLGADLGVAPLPSLNGRKLVSPRATHALFFPARSLAGPRGVSLRMLAAYFARPEVQLRWFDSGRRLPAAKLARDQALKRVSGPTAELLRALDGAAAIPNDAKLPHMWVALRRGIHFTTLGLRGPAEACAMMQALLDGSEP